MKVKPEQYRKMVEALLKSDVLDGQHMMGLLVLGEAGVGKTYIAREVARELGFEISEVYLGNMGDPGDARGMPIVRDGKTTWAVSEEFVCQQPTMLLLDEVTRAPVFMHSLIATLMTSASVAPGHKLDPAKVKVVATGNPWDSDDYQVSEIDKAIRDRFMIIELVPDWDQWYSWAAGMIEKISDNNASAFAADIAAIVAANPELQQYSPRSWWWAIEAAALAPADLRSMMIEARCPATWSLIEEMRNRGTILPSVKELKTDPKGSIEKIEKAGDLTAWGVRRLAYVVTQLVKELDEEQDAQKERVIAELMGVLKADIPQETRTALISLVPKQAAALLFKYDKSALIEIQKVQAAFRDARDHWIHSIGEEQSQS